MIFCYRITRNGHDNSEVDGVAGITTLVPVGEVPRDGRPNGGALEFLAKHVTGDIYTVIVPVGHTLEVYH